MLDAIAQKVGLKINPHLLRHASATLLYEATGDIYAVQHHLRHSKVVTCGELLNTGIVHSI